MPLIEHYVSLIKRRIAALGSLVALCAATAGAQGPIGPEIQVNTHTTSDGGFLACILGDCGPQASSEPVRVDDGASTPSEPAVAMTCDGRALALWTAADSNGLRSIAARWMIDGALAGSIFQVNTTPGDPKQPDARVTADGRIVVSWRDGVNLRWRSFDPATLAGSAEQSVTVGGEVLGHGIGPAGELAAAWQAGPASVFQGQRFDSSGSELGDAFEVGNDPELSVRRPHFGQSAEGFVVSYDAIGYDDIGYSTTYVKTKRFSSPGTPITTDFVLERGRFGIPVSSWVGRNRVDANTEGDFVITWLSEYTNKYTEVTQSVRARLFDSNGSSPADRGASGLDSGTPAAALGPARQFLVVWNDESAGLTGRRVLPSMTDLDPAVEISASEPEEMDVAYGLPSSAASIIWTSSECAGPAPCVLLSTLLSGPGVLADGFESGDSSAWCRGVGVQ